MPDAFQNPPNAPPGSEALELIFRKATAKTLSLEN
jgi:hypothetical protein